MKIYLGFDGVEYILEALGTGMGQPLTHSLLVSNYLNSSYLDLKFFSSKPILLLYHVTAILRPKHLTYNCNALQTLPVCYTKLSRNNIYVLS